MKLSVVTVAYNSASTIGDTMQSVVAQNWDDYEHIIVDGASRDLTLATVAKYQSPRMFVVSEPDSGPYDAMNKGLVRATGDAVGFLNSDDFFCRPDALRMITEAFAGGADCVSGQTITVHRNDIYRVDRLYTTHRYRPWMLRFGHMPSHPSFYIRKTIFDDLGGFDPEYRIAGDFDLMVRLLIRMRARMTIIPQTLVAFREGGVSSRNFRAKMTMNREIARSLRAQRVGSHPALLWSRYPFKFLQKLGRVNDYPRYLSDMGLPTQPG